MGETSGIELALSVSLVLQANHLNKCASRIQGKKHKIGKYKINKISLLCFDDKSYVLNHGIHTLAYVHKNLLKIDYHRRS